MRDRGRWLNRGGHRGGETFAASAIAHRWRRPHALLFAAALTAAAFGCASKPLPEAALSAVTSTGEAVPLDSVTALFEVGGVTVIHRPTTANDIVAASLYLLGGSRQLTPSTAGIEALLLMASEYGTKKYPGERTRRAAGLTGSRFVVKADVDWTVFGFHGLTSEFDSTWSVLADRLMHPTLDSTAVAIVRSRMLTALRASRESPDGLVRRLVDSVAFEGHAYALSPMGTDRALRAITIEELRRYHAEQMVTSRMLLVVVGNVPREQVERAVEETLGTLPRGSYVWEPPPVWGDGADDAPHGIAVHARDLPTNYILGFFAGPPSSHRDHAAFRLATALLGARMHSRIRSEGLSYVAYAPYLERGAPAGGVYVSTVSPQRAMRVINEVIDGLRSDAPTRSSLTFFAEQFIMDYFQENSTNAAQADFLARAHLHRGDWRLASSYMAELRRVSPSAIRTAANTYMRNIRYAYVGNPALVPVRELRRWERE